MARKSFGSGRNAKPRTFVDDVPAINVFVLNKAGALVSGVVTDWRWKGNQSGRARAGNGKVSISVDGRPEVAILVDWIDNSQGSFPLFRCPCCNKRRQSLYIREQIACRRCSGALDYLSQFAWNRPALRVMRLRKRLVSDPPVYAARRRRMLQLLAAAEQKASSFMAATVSSAEYRIERLRK
jgi:hypothetical protein